MVFDPKKYLIKVNGGKQYLPVSARLIWFREQHPDWGIETRASVIDIEKQYAVFEAIVYNGDGKLMAKGTKMEDARGFPDYVEKAETGAIGRALAVCGFGTQFAPELDELASGRFVDSPQPSGDTNGRDRYDQGRYGNGRDSGYRNQGRQAPEQPRPAPAMSPRPSPASQTGIESGIDPFADIVTDSPPAHPAPPIHRESAQDAPLSDPNGKHACAACGRELTQSQEVFSERKYGMALCPTCQKERRAAEA